MARLTDRARNDLKCVEGPLNRNHTKQKKKRKKKQTKQNKNKNKQQQKKTTTTKNKTKKKTNKKTKTNKNKFISEKVVLESITAKTPSSDHNKYVAILLRS